MKVAVTGGSGVVGGAVVRHLLGAGHEVVALARSEASSEKLTRSGARTVRGDVLDVGSLHQLVDGVDWLFHIAGVNEMCSKDPEHMDEVNIDGTLNVITACVRAKVGRMVQTSSAVTLGEEAGEIGLESTRHRGYHRSRYERSKHLSEGLVIEVAGSLDVVIVNPSSVQGPGRSTGTGKLLLDAARGGLRFVADTTFSIVDIDDCARGHLLAAERGTAGERYVLSGFTLSMADAVEMVARATGRGLSPVMVPLWLVSSGASVVEWAARMVRKQPPVCREMVRVLQDGAAYDGSRATRDLGLRYTSAEETIARTIAWFGTEGLLD